MLVDVTSYQEEQARCVINTETGTAAQSRAHHGPPPHHGARSGGDTLGGAGMRLGVAGGRRGVAVRGGGAGGGQSGVVWGGVV
jgi:hypothetical protein